MTPWEYIKSTDHYMRAVGHPARYASAVPFTYDDGPARGMRGIEVSTGSGFTFTVLPDRGLDIGEARMNGVPIAWMGKPGIKAPGCCHPGPGEFPEYFFGGLLTTCGFDNVGASCWLGGVFYPQHGRRTLIPAEDVAIRKFWHDGEYYIEISGIVRSGALFGQHIINGRTLRVKMGGTSVEIRDRIINDGTRNEPYMLLYHCNFGFPIVSADSEIVFNHAGFSTFNEAANARNPHLLGAPERGFAECVYSLEQAPGKTAKAAVLNEKAGIGAYVASSVEELPMHTEWVNLEEEDYVVGLEPGTNLPVGRERALAEGTAPILAPGETKDSGVVIGVLTGDIRQGFEAVNLFAE